MKAAPCKRIATSLFERLETINRVKEIEARRETVEATLLCVRLASRLAAKRASKERHAHEKAEDESLVHWKRTGAGCSWEIDSGFWKEDEDEDKTEDRNVLMEAEAKLWRAAAMPLTKAAADVKMEARVVHLEQEKQEGPSLVSLIDEKEVTQLLKEGAALVPLEYEAQFKTDTAVIRVEEKYESLFQKIVRQFEKADTLDPNFATGTEALRVAVRCRPLSRNEMIDGRKTIARVYETMHQVSLLALGRKTAPRQFNFDVAMGARATQKEVFDKCGRSSKSISDCLISDIASNDCSVDLLQL